MTNTVVALRELAEEAGVGVQLRVPRPLRGLLLYLRRTPTPASSESVGF